MSLNETFDYIQEATIKTIQMCKEYGDKKGINLDANKLKNDVNNLFEYIHKAAI